jgi:proteasome accessory factor C
VTSTADRLPRLLALVPYLLAHPGSRLSEVSRTFGITEKQLRADLNLLFVCGLPGHTPADLMEYAIAGDRVTMRNADTLARPLRLTAEEGLALIVALRTVQDLPGVGDAAARALAKLETALGDAAEAASRVAVAVDTGADATLRTVSQALTAGRRVHLTYYVPGRDETTERDVDPVRVTWADGRPYLQGWCRRAEDMRLFRLDRVLGISVLDTPAEVPAEVAPRDLSRGVYQPTAEHLSVELRLAPGARWVTEYYPCEAVEERPDGGLDVRLRTPDAGWLVRLVLSLGGLAQVLSPADLVEAARREAAAALAGYR